MSERRWSKNVSRLLLPLDDDDDGEEVRFPFFLFFPSYLEKRERERRTLWECRRRKADHKQGGKKSEQASKLHSLSLHPTKSFSSSRASAWIHFLSSHRLCNLLLLLLATPKGAIARLKLN